MRVAVVGAGAAGLVALRHLTARPQVFTAVAFEQSSEIGGTWVYTDQVGTDENGRPIHSSMYKNLKTNLPKEVMAFPDFPFSENLPSFLTHQEVREYLEDYTDHFHLRKFIKFNTTVERVHPITEGDPKTKWEVTTRCLSKQQGVTEVYDAVMVCNGHYAEPLVPDIPGSEKFKGQLLHSHNYRNPQSFTGKRVAILGAAASGQDIMLDIAPVADKVFICHRKPPLASKLPNNVRQGPGIRELTAQGIILENDEKVDIDVLLFCTGYRYTFPFLTRQCHLVVEGERITPLYKHLIHTEYPTFSIVGVCKTVCPFPQFDCQVKFVLSALDGSMVLPTEEEMNQTIAEDYKWRLSQGMPHRHAHTMGPLQWGYNDDLADLAKFTPVPPVVRNLYDAVHTIRSSELMIYKQKEFRLKNRTEFMEVSSASA